MDFKDDEDENKKKRSKVKAIITDMLLKATPKDIVTEAAQKRYDDPIKVTLFMVIKYQPGNRREKEAVLQRISCPEACWSDDKALYALKMWKRKIERAQELKPIIPDPFVLLSGLDTIAENVIKRGRRRSFRVESSRGAIIVDVVSSFDAA